MNYLLEGEGKFVEQTKEMQTKTINGEEVIVYVRGTPRDVYIMEWSKKKAQDMLTNKKYFGEDTINITNPNEVVYTVKFPNSNPPRTSFGMQDFLDYKYEKLQELSRTIKSPYLADLERRVNPYK